MTLLAASWSFPPGVILLGVITGLTYGLLAVGLVLVYRSSRFINFAHGEIGAFGSAVLGKLVVGFGVPYWIAFVIAIGVSASLGAFTEGVLLRRLRSAPKLMSMVASLVLATFLVFASIVVNSEALAGTVFPKPAGFPSWQLGALLATPAHTAMVFLAPLAMAGLFLFLTRSRFGLAIRAAASNPDAAAMAGMAPTSMATMTWAIAGAVAALTAMLVLPTRGLLVGPAFGLSLLLPALAAAVIARMKNLPVAFAAGIGAGLIEKVVSFNTGSDGAVAAILFAIILLALLLQAKEHGRQREKGNWLATQAWPRVPETLRDHPLIAGAPWVLGAIGVALAVWGNLASTNAVAFAMNDVMALAIVGLSIGMLTGLNGQLSLGQFAVAAFGAFASWYFSANSGSFPLGLVAGMFVGAMVSVLVGLPALRVRGLLLAVTTLAFALASQSWILQQGVIFGDGVTPGRPIAFGEDLDKAGEYYWVVLLGLIAALLVMRNLRRGGFGRLLIGLRDNEDNARAFTVSSHKVTLTAYAVAGAFAGLGGALYGHNQPQLTPAFFLANTSIDVVVMTVVGGIGALVGPVLGALYVVGIRRIIDLDTAGLALHSLVMLALVVFAPGGMVGLLRPVRDAWVNFVARRAKVDLDVEVGEVSIGDAAPTDKPAATVLVRARTNGKQDRRHLLRPLLQVDTITKSYGGVQAVRGVSLEVLEGETVGLVGPNGAGKTTMFELITGFVPSDSGTIRFAGEDITHLGPEDRAQRGLVRSFQDATLFPTMSLLETVMLAHERVDPTRLAHSVLGLQAAEIRKESHSRELIALMGLDDFRDKQLGELSTGTRRIAELTCALALQPRVLLLDEPAAGVAQKETEALGSLLSAVKRQLQTTLVIIEHDIPLLASISDWMVAMESGSLLVEGVPADVQNSDAVIESFLGGDPTAIQRSGTTAAATTGASR